MLEVVSGVRKPRSIIDVRPKGVESGLGGKLYSFKEIYEPKS